MDALVKYGNGNRESGETRTFSVPLEVLARLLFALVPITKSKTYVVDIETLSDEVVIDTPTPLTSSCDVDVSSSTKQAQPASLDFQAIASFTQEIAAEEQWKWSIWQTALLLCLVTNSPQMYFSKFSAPWRELVTFDMVSKLQHELADGVEAAMAAGAAAGKPVGLVQLMDWLGPLSHGCVGLCRSCVFYGSRVQN